jgi:predicted nucleic acid-binding protein
MRLVADASVAVKWFVGEAGSDDAATLLESRSGRSGSLELAAPQFLLLEVVAGAGRRARSELAQPGHPAQVLQASSRLRLAPAPDAELLDHATQRSATLRRPVYDCLHPALSRRFSAPLATFDTGLSEIARRDGSLWELP